MNTGYGRGCDNLVAHGVVVHGCEAVQNGGCAILRRHLAVGRRVTVAVLARLAHQLTDLSLNLAQHCQSEILTSM